MSQTFKPGQKRRVTLAYQTAYPDATELSAEVGEELVVGFEESGWLWCTNQAGQSGWIPADHVE